MGVASGLAGLGLLGLALLGIYRMLVERAFEVGFWLFVVSCLGLATMFALLGWRLITGMPRRDGGLLSPLGLRLGGLLLLSAMAAFLVDHPWQILSVLGLLGGVVTSFSLAKRRKQNPSEL